MSPKEVAPLGSDVDDFPTLRLQDIQGESEQELVARGAALAREYAAIEHKPTILAKNLAVVLVAVREKHGDWLGQSHDYRQTAAEIYALANIPKGSQDRIKAAVRYHIGNELRRVLTPREIRALGLLESSPLERLQDNRSTNAVLLAATKAIGAAEESTPKTEPSPTKGRGTGKQAEVEVPKQAGAPVKATADHLRLALVAGNILGQFDADVIDRHMTAGQRDKLDAELVELQKKITKLRRHTRKPSSGGK